MFDRPSVTYLRDRAAICRRLAETASDDYRAWALTSIAEDYERRADALAPCDAPAECIMA